MAKQVMTLPQRAHHIISKDSKSKSKRSNGNERKQKGTGASKSRERVNGDRQTTNEERGLPRQARGDRDKVKGQIKSGPLTQINHLDKHYFKQSTDAPVQRADTKWQNGGKTGGKRRHGEAEARREAREWRGMVRQPHSAPWARAQLTPLGKRAYVSCGQTSGLQATT